jgi:hypothetical protein
VSKKAFPPRRSGKWSVSPLRITRALPWGEHREETVHGRIRIRVKDARTCRGVADSVVVIPCPAVR